MAHPTILDPQAIETLRSLSPDTDGSFLRDLVEIYVEDTPVRIAEIESGLAKGDASIVLRAAHTIKGSSGNFGARDFVRMALEIETLAKAVNLPAAALLLPAFKEEYEKVVTALRQLTVPSSSQ